MATTANIGIKISGGGTLTSTDALASPTQQASIGSGTFSSLDLNFSNGSGNSQISNWYLGQRTVNAGANDDIDLTAILNALAVALGATKIKVFLIRIVSPDGTKVLRVGPGAVSNPWNSWIGGTNPYLLVYDWFLLPNRYGYTVTATTGMNLRVTNPGASSVTYDLWLIGNN